MCFSFTMGYEKLGCHCCSWRHREVSRWYYWDNQAALVNSLHSIPCLHGKMKGQPQRTQMLKLLCSHASLLGEPEKSIQKDPCILLTTRGKKEGHPHLHSQLVNDLGMPRYICRHHNLLTEHANAIRPQRCSKLLAFLKHQGGGKVAVHVDQKKLLLMPRWIVRMSKSSGLIPRGSTCLWNQTSSLCLALWCPCQQQEDHDIKPGLKSNMPE